MRRTRPVLDRFWEKIRLGDPDACWNWLVAVDQHGYGKIRIGGRRATGGRDVKAHQFSYEIKYGPVPEGLEIDHLCRNPRCVNPVHLEAVTHGENMRRGMSISGRNFRKTHCSRGHAFDEGNTQIKIDNRGRTHRSCKTCHREGQRRRRSRTKEYPKGLL